MARRTLLGHLAALGPLLTLNAAAQVALPPQDPLARIRAAANQQACSVTETSACAQANPKIVSSALGPASSLAGSLRALREIGPRVTGMPGMDRAAAWAVAAFHQAGAENIHIEESATTKGVAQKNVVAEIRGRENPQDFVVLAANLDTGPRGKLDEGCNAALVIEAARLIELTGLRPRRSIRFVLFSGRQEGMPGSRAYVQAHGAEINHAVAALIFENGCGRVTGFSLERRQDLEAAVRESLAFAPLDAWELGHDTNDAALADNLDFLLEGIPTLVANRDVSKNNLADLDLKRAAAVAGVIAFAFAEHPAAPGPRLSRPEIAALLRSTGLDAKMKAQGLWPSWESGVRGRQP
jgi:hypothetical protein